MVERATPIERAIARSVAPQACLRRRISRIRRIDTLVAGIGSSSWTRGGPLRSPAVERSPPQQAADFILEWVADIKSESVADFARNPHQAKFNPTALEGRLLGPVTVAQDEEVLPLDRDHEALEPFGPPRRSGSEHDGPHLNVGPAAGLLHRGDALPFRWLHGSCRGRRGRLACPGRGRAGQDLQRLDPAVQ